MPLPNYNWQGVEGFCEENIGKLQEILESTAHLIIQFARDGGFDSAVDF